MSCFIVEQKTKTFINIQINSSIIRKYIKKKAVIILDKAYIGFLQMTHTE